jgi:hypothetical protein
MHAALPSWPQANEAILSSLLSGSSGKGLDFASIKAGERTGEELERFDRVQASGLPGSRPLCLTRTCSTPGACTR